MSMEMAQAMPRMSSVRVQGSHPTSSGLFAALHPALN